MKNYIKLFEEFDPLSPDDTSDLMSLGLIEPNVPILADRIEDAPVDLAEADLKILQWLDLPMEVVMVNIDAGIDREEEFISQLGPMAQILDGNGYTLDATKFSEMQVQELGRWTPDPVYSAGQIIDYGAMVNGKKFAVRDMGYVGEPAFIFSPADWPEIDLTGLEEFIHNAIK